MYVLEEDWGDGWRVIGHYTDKVTATIDHKAYKEDICLRKKEGTGLYELRLRKVKQ